MSERYASTLRRIDHGVAQILTLGEEYERALSHSNISSEPPHLAEPEDGLIILYTSGTTGMPKGAVISHRAMVARTLIGSLDRPLARDDSYLAWTPMFHMGSTDYVYSTLLRGGKVIVLDGFQAGSNIAGRCRRAARLAAFELCGDRAGHCADQKRWRAAKRHEVRRRDGRPRAAPADRCPDDIDGRALCEHFRLDRNRAGAGEQRA